MTDAAFNWRIPDYEAVRAQRTERLLWLRENPNQVPLLKLHYATHIAEFITDWGMTSDPRNRNKDLPTEVPFVLFDRQREYIDFILERMRTREPGLVEKSRDCGCSWLSMCLAVTLCLFNRGVVVGVGSSKESKVDRSGDPDSLLWKARFFLRSLPPEFRGSWDETRNSAHMRITFPDSGCAIVGEAGDDIGRGGRSTLYLIDEGAFIERPALIEASLAGNTECRIDVSTPNGPVNAFAVKRHSGRVKVFQFHWRSDPRKDDAWYQQQCERLDPITRRQEIDLDYNARVEGVLIPTEWVHAAVGAHQKLGVEVTGARRGALDVADEGRDLCAFAGRHGILLEHLHSWSGKGSDIYQTVVRTFGLCEDYGCESVDFDADGVGAGVRGDAVNINSQRTAAGKREIEVIPFRGSGAVFDPDGSMVEGRLNRDYFANTKAQSWWALRLRFQATYRAVVEKMPYNPDELISIDPNLPELTQLVTELSQPTYSINAVGKILIDKMPDGAASPNRADAAMIAFAVRSGAYFASPPAVREGETTTGHPMPRCMDFVFSVVCVIEDAAAVVYFAANRPGDGTRGLGFYVLDWDLRQLDAQALPWIGRIVQRLAELHRTIRAVRPAQMFCDSFSEGFAELMRQHGFPAASLGDRLPPTAEERFNNARPYVNVGLVPFTQAALDRQVTFRGATRNFLRELASQAQVTESNPLAIAFATGILITYRDRPAVPTPGQVPVQTAPIAAPRPAPVSTIPLRPGRHVINGVTVEVPADGDKDWVDYPVTPGNHIVDSIMVNVQRPGAGIRLW